MTNPVQRGSQRTSPSIDLLESLGSAQVLVFDRDFQVENHSEGLRRLFARWPALQIGGEGVPAEAVRFVREHATAYRAAGERETTALMFPDLLVHIVDVQGSAGMKIVAAFINFAHRDPIRQASRAFNLTPREGQVVALLLRGCRAAEVAKALDISELTVGDYFKRLRSKTGARTQSGMIARLLGWEIAGRPAVAPDVKDTS